MCAYQGIRNVSSPENFAHLPNEWSHKWLLRPMILYVIRISHQYFPWFQYLPLLCSNCWRMWNNVSTGKHGYKIGYGKLSCCPAGFTKTISYNKLYLKWEITCVILSYWLSVRLITEFTFIDLKLLVVSELFERVIHSITILEPII